MFAICLALNTEFSGFLPPFCLLSLSLTTLFIDSHGHNYVSYMNMWRDECFSVFDALLVWFHFYLSAIITIIIILLLLLLLFASSHFRFFALYFAFPFCTNVIWAVSRGHFWLFLEYLCIHVQHVWWICVSIYSLLALTSISNINFIFIESMSERQEKKHIRQWLKQQRLRRRRNDQFYSPKTSKREKRMAKALNGQYYVSQCENKWVWYWYWNLL